MTPEERARRILSQWSRCDDSTELLYSLIVGALGRSRIEAIEEAAKTAARVASEVYENNPSAAGIAARMEIEIRHL